MHDTWSPRIIFIWAWTSDFTISKFLLSFAPTFTFQKITTYLTSISSQRSLNVFVTRKRPGRNMRLFLFFIKVISLWRKTFFLVIEFFLWTQLIIINSLQRSLRSQLILSIFDTFYSLVKILLQNYQRGFFIFYLFQSLRYLSLSRFQLKEKFIQSILFR